jgi:biopolymer transport protein ExbD
MSLPSESLRMGKRPQNSKHKRRHRMSHSKGPHLDQVRNDINVTPLVDVMLVLLIIFMLMTLIMGRGQDVQLPKAKNYSSEKDKLQPVVTIDAAGDLFVEKSKLGPIGPATLKEMELQVKAMWAAPKNPDGAGRLYLKAHHMVEYETIYPVLIFMHKEMALDAVDLAISKQEAE